MELMSLRVCNSAMSSSSLPQSKSLLAELVMIFGGKTHMVTHKEYIGYKEFT
jgi:hypothetical protein